MADRQASLDLAARAGLRWTSDETPGLRRVRRGQGFSYVDPEGRTVGENTRRWIESLVIPPAWSDVWISPDRQGHILATGKDEAGRKQYIYHPDWEEARDEVKFDRLGEFGARLTGLRRRIQADLGRPGLERDRIVALAVAVLDRTLIRIGNRQYADTNDSYGLTTLTREHVELKGSNVRFTFAGKAGAEQEVTFSDAALADLLSACRRLGGETILAYPTDGPPRSVTADDVNQYLAEGAGDGFTAKDFRTWGATATVVGQLARQPEPDLAPEKQFLAAVDAAAERLGNTREVCRGSYVHPVVEDAFDDGRLDRAWSRSRRGRWLNRSESATRKLLEG